MEAPEPELYDLARDPGETTNVAAEHPERADRMAVRIREIAAREHTADSIELDAAARDALESLGYATTRTSVDESLPDPKRMIGIMRLIERAQAFMAAGQWQAALVPLRGALGRDPNNKDVHRSLGLVYAASGRDPQAIDSYLRCLELPPHVNDRIPRFEVASAYLRIRRYEEAAKHLERILEVDPDDADVWYNLGVAREPADRAAARAAWQRSLEPAARGGRRAVAQDELLSGGGKLHPSAEVPGAVAQQR